MDEPTAVLVAARAVHDTACILIPATWVVDLWVVTPAGPPPRRWRAVAWWMTAICLVAAIVSGLIWFGCIATLMSGLPAAQALRQRTLVLVLWKTRFGTLWRWRGAIAAACAVVLALRLRWPMLVVGILLLSSLAWTGHGDYGHYPQVHRAIDATHLAILAVWPGGLVPFSIVFFQARRSPALGPMVRRFSALSLASVGALLITGAANGFFMLRRFSDLWRVQYGQTLLLKVSLVIVMIGFGAVNLLWLKPGITRGTSPRAASRMRVTMACEVALAVLVIVVVAKLGLLMPH